MVGVHHKLYYKYYGHTLNSATIIFELLSYLEMRSEKKVRPVNAWNTVVFRGRGNIPGMAGIVGRYVIVYLYYWELI